MRDPRHTHRRDTPAKAMTVPGAPGSPQSSVRTRGASSPAGDERRRSDRDLALAGTAVADYEGGDETETIVRKRASADVFARAVERRP
jgi:hypothetical protein